MSKIGRLTDTEKGMIHAYHDAGKSNRWIGTKLGKNESSIRYFLKNENNGKKKRGPKEKISAAMKRMIIRNASNKSISCAKIKTECNLNVSVESVRNILNKSGTIRYKKMLVKPPLKPQHRINRVCWAKDKMSWVTEWENVIWSDEKKFNLDGPDGYAYYWHDLRKEEISFSKRHTGGGSLLIWGCFNYHGKSNLAIITDRLNQYDYQMILGKHLLPFMNDFSGDKPILQQDNCRCHVARSTLQWLQDRNIDVMSWPPYSPDLNPIENLWGILARRVYANGKQYESISELEREVFRCWEEIDNSVLLALVNSMPNRIYKVIYSHGSSIKY